MLWKCRSAILWKIILHHLSVQVIKGGKTTFCYHFNFPCINSNGLQWRWQCSHHAVLRTGSLRELISHHPHCSSGTAQHFTVQSTFRLYFHTSWVWLALWVPKCALTVRQNLHYLSSGEVLKLQHKRLKAVRQTENLEIPVVLEKKRSVKEQNQK